MTADQLYIVTTEHGELHRCRRQQADPWAVKAKSDYHGFMYFDDDSDLAIEGETIASVELKVPLPQPAAESHEYPLFDLSKALALVDRLRQRREPHDLSRAARDAADLDNLAYCLRLASGKPEAATPDHQTGSDFEQLVDAVKDRPNVGPTPCDGSGGFGPREKGTLGWLACPGCEKCSTPDHRANQEPSFATNPQRGEHIAANAQTEGTDERTMADQVAGTSPVVITGSEGGASASASPPPTRHGRTDHQGEAVGLLRELVAAVDQYVKPQMPSERSKVSSRDLKRVLGTATEHLATHPVPEPLEDGGK
mgnify:CR=1 FL=1